MSTTPDVCPTCGSPAIPIMYGLPSPEAFEAADHNEISIGGCVIEDGMPTHTCAADHRWAVDGPG